MSCAKPLKIVVPFPLNQEYVFWLWDDGDEIAFDNNDNIVE